MQPYDERVEDGETALVFLGGRQSHAFTKGPILPSPGSRPAFDDSGTYAEESLTPADPDFELWDVGQAALAAAAAHLGIDVAELLYARVDLIGGPTDPKLLELELVEPSLGWRQLDAATRSRRQSDFVVGVEDSPRAPWPRTALASTPIARRWPQCTRPHPRRGWPPASPGHR